MRCPWPALRLARAMRTAAAVRLHADDPAAGGEVAAMAMAHGWQVMRIGAMTFDVTAAVV